MAPRVAPTAAPRVPAVPPAAVGWHPGCPGAASIPFAATRSRSSPPASIPVHTIRTTAFGQSNCTARTKAIPAAPVRPTGRRRNRPPPPSATSSLSRCGSSRGPDGRSGGRARLEPQRLEHPGREPANPARRHPSSLRGRRPRRPAASGRSPATPPAQRPKPKPRSADAERRAGRGGGRTRPRAVAAAVTAWCPSIRPATDQVAIASAEPRSTLPRSFAGPLRRERRAPGGRGQVVATAPSRRRGCPRRRGPPARSSRRAPHRGSPRRRAR